MKIINKIHYSDKTTSNTIIIDYAFQYRKDKPNYKDILYRINRVRMDKLLFLPFEMVYVDGI